MGAGIYHADDQDTSYLQLMVNANVHDAASIIEVQKRHKDNLMFAIAPSIITHTTPAEIATTDWVFQAHPFDPEANVWQIGNNLQIFTMPLNTKQNALTTVTFNIPFSKPPMCFLHAWITWNDARALNPILQNPTATTIDVDASINGAIVPCFCTLLAIGYKG